MRALNPPAKGSRITDDEEVRGFGARITAKGATSFVLNYFVAGRERRITIGSFPAWSCSAARARAAELRRQVDAGGDPLAEREAERGAPTLADLVARYLAEVTGTKRAGTQAEDKALLGLVVAEIGRMNLADVKRADLERLHRKVTVERGGPRANRLLTAIGAIFARGIAWDLTDANPTKGISRNPEEPRERYLRPTSWSACWPRWPSAASSRAPLRSSCCCWTGARRGEILGALWEQFDLATGVWTKPSTLTKQKKRHRVPLSGPARMLLARMAAKAEGPALFPGTGESGTLVEIKRTWHAVRRRPILMACGCTICGIPTPASSPPPGCRCPSSAVCSVTHKHRQRTHATPAPRPAARPNGWASW